MKGPTACSQGAGLAPSKKLTVFLHSDQPEDAKRGVASREQGRKMDYRPPGQSEGKLIPTAPIVPFRGGHEHPPRETTRRTGDLHRPFDQVVFGTGADRS